MPPIVLPPRQNKRKRRSSWVLRLIGFAFASGVVMFLAGAGAVGYVLWKYSRDLPNYEVLAKYEPPVMTRIHAHDGALIAEFAREKRIFVPINTIPKLLIQAFLSAEDKHFYEHGGLDYQGIGRAVFNNLKHYGRGGPQQGASTITQQVAKNFLLTNEQRLGRKVKEAILAVRIEHAFTKDQILELYLNEIYLGIGSYGVAAAALNYFGKELEEINIEEAAYLAALPKGPNNYHPFKKTDAAVTRRNWILGQMELNGFITKQQAQKAQSQPLKVNLRPFGAHIFAAEFFSEEVRRALLAQYGEDKLYGGGLSVRTTLDPKLQRMARLALIDGLVGFDRTKGWRGPVNRIDMAGDWAVNLTSVDNPADITPWRLGVVLEVQKTKIVVGLKPGRQADGSILADRDKVEVGFEEMKWAGKYVDGTKPKSTTPKAPADVVAVGDVVYVAPREVAQLLATGGAPSQRVVWSLMQVPEVGGAIVVMDPHTGRVLADVGGFSFASSQFDRVVQAKRQPGSSFKPLVYAAAMDNGYKPTSIILDEPLCIEQIGKDCKNIANFGNEGSAGPTTLRNGIVHSRNQMTVRLAQDMGMPLITEYAVRRFGVYDDLLPVLSMSIGAGETTLLRMTTAYCMLANGGKQVRTTFIDRIQDRWGKSIWRHDDRDCPECRQEGWKGQDEPDVADDRRQIMDPHTAYQMTEMMEGVVQAGTGQTIRAVGKPLAGKTGTTNDSKDAWFIGYSPDLVVGVFMGYDTPRSLGHGTAATGGAVAAPVFRDFMKMALADKPATPFRQPAGIKMIWVNSKTGLKAAAGDGDAILEAFKPNEEPDDDYSAIGYTTGGDGSFRTPSVDPREEQADRRDRGGMRLPWGRGY